MNSIIMRGITIRLLSVLFILSFVFATSFSQSQIGSPSKADAILGIWHPEGKDYHVKIYKDGDEYLGKIIWIQNPLDKFGSPKKDKNNPERRHRGQKVLNMINISGLTFNTTFSLWEDGYIYFPETGETMLGNVELVDSNTMRLIGFIGFSLEEVELTWKRMV